MKGDELIEDAVGVVGKSDAHGEWVCIPRDDERRISPDAASLQLVAGHTLRLESPTSVLYIGPSLKLRSRNVRHTPANR